MSVTKMDKPRRRRRKDYFPNENLTARQKYVRRNRISGLCPDCPRPTLGAYRCSRHRRSVARAMRRSNSRHPERTHERNLARRQRYAHFRKHNYSPAEARIYSGSLKYLISAPSPAPAAPPVRKIPVWREPGPRVKRCTEREFMDWRDKFFPDTHMF
jgi:hypothetical protein